jgi:hypothetical protein
MINPADLAIQIPTVLVPSDQVDLSKWSVIACDQYTSNPKYWAAVRKHIGSSPSTLDLILPEVYLHDPELDTRIQEINKQMQTFLAEQILLPLAPGLILIDRQTAHVSSRKGLLLAVDLEQYEYRRGAKSLIRPTEETIAQRLPPRMKIRAGGSLELPHIMLLLDDPEHTVIEPLFRQATKNTPLYNFDLMMAGGHLTGYHVNDPNLLKQTWTALSHLLEPEVTTAKYGVGAEPFLFAVGDGNHSLATAKALWERIKSESSNPATLSQHPARFCLVEVVNLYDEGLLFHPIHRVLFNVDPERFFRELQDHYRYRIATTSSPEIITTPDVQAFHFYTSTDNGKVVIENPSTVLTVGSLQAFLDDYLARHPETTIDYIHGEKESQALGREPGNLSLILPPINKCELFQTVIREGTLPRKTFSLGEADEKRFYFEARKITMD